MKETLVYTLDKHYIYYLSCVNFGFYIVVPFKEFNETNISIRLKGNYEMYDPNRHSTDTIINELINYYKNIDNYNITLILPVFYNDILTRIRTVDDMEIYQKIDMYLGNIFNEAYKFLTKNNIKVNSNIYVINNDSFKKFTNWFVSKYNNRIEYKTILDLIRQSGNFNSYNMVETPNINFVVGKNTVPDLGVTAEVEVETFDNYVKSMEEKEAKQDKKVEAKSAGFVSYILLGAVTFIVSLALLFLLVK